jgi:exopolyphosphatase/guanosine-5'-triphosphate,3'-diphosphate pyrophosphatase
LAPDRADIIVAGIAIVDRLMRRFKVNLLQVHSRGVRDGLLLTMIDNTLGAASADPVDREAAIERFAAACTGEQELAHGKQVARLVGRIFDQIAERFKLDPADRPFLEAAARLQDVGYLINYDQHHKHSYQLILNSRLSGFRPRELELIANIARYHRGARPKKKHANFRQLPPEDQLRVRRLSAILRVAVGLDRSHSQQVKDVTVVWDETPASKRRSKQPSSKQPLEKLELLVHSDTNPEVDLWGARRRVKLFKKVFGAKLDVQWIAPADSTSTDVSTSYTTADLPGSESGDGQPSGEGAHNGASRKPLGKPRH